MKYSLDIADKYHFLKAEYIVRKSTEATAQAKRGKAPRKDTEEKKGFLDIKSTNIEEPSVSSQNVAKKEVAMHMRLH